MDSRFSPARFHGVRTCLASVSVLGWVLILGVAVIASGLAGHLVYSESIAEYNPPGDVSWYPSREGIALSRKRWLKLARESHWNWESRDPQIVLVGDSITYLTQAFQRDTWNEVYAAGQTLNLGIPGDCTQHVLWRLYRYPLAQIEPDVAIVLLGVNNLRMHTPAETAAGVAQVVKLLRRQLPRTEILLLGLLPVGSELGYLSSAVRDTNQLLKSWAAHLGVAYVDLGPHFRSPGGRIRRELYTDEVHLSDEGIRVWATALKPILSRKLSSPDSVILDDEPIPARGGERAKSEATTENHQEGSGAGSGT